MFHAPRLLAKSREPEDVDASSLLEGIHDDHGAHRHDSEELNNHDAPRPMRRATARRTAPASHRGEHARGPTKRRGIMPIRESQSNGKEVPMKRT